MAHGQQKIQSQQEAAKNKRKNSHSQESAAKSSLICTCSICMTRLPDPKIFKQQLQHPKTLLPPELVEA
ncbi:zinc finger protein 706-like [Protopterus annectens]|uniref:zinc finger protein 706-like n=1 Tax=Protopterus annectens TaxID=7888 RepID=UPI001CFBF395|nr:zinc finger protein 706-like [Protopterus annectens]